MFTSRNQVKSTKASSKVSPQSASANVASAKPAASKDKKPNNPAAVSVKVLYFATQCQNQTKHCLNEASSQHNVSPKRLITNPSSIPHWLEFSEDPTYKESSDYQRYGEPQSGKVSPDPAIENQLMQHNEKHEMVPDTTNAQSIGLDQRQNEGDEGFDWERDDESGEDHQYNGENRAGTRAVKNIMKRPWVKWLVILLVDGILIAITAVLHVQFADKETDVSRNLQLWFVFLSFIYTMSLLMIGLVELIPNIVKRFVRSMTPTTLEMLKMRLETVLTFASAVLDVLKKSLRKKPSFALNEHDKARHSWANERSDGRIENRKSETSNTDLSMDEKDINHQENAGRRESSDHDPAQLQKDTVEIPIPSPRRSRCVPFHKTLSESCRKRPTLSARSNAFDAKSFIDFGASNLKFMFSSKAKSMAAILPGSRTSRQEAKWLARQLFNNMVSPERDVLVKEDFEEYFATSEEAKRAFDVFDKNGNGDISKREIRNTTLQTFKERKNLAASLRDLSTASGKLDNILLAAFAVLWTIIVCAAFGVDVGTQLLPLWTMFVAISFIFGNSAKDMFDSIIFVFVSHPYDVGDRVYVGTENWVVEEIDLLTTTFKKWDGTKLYARNAVIAPQYIYNLRRSGPMAEVIEMNFNFSTPEAKFNQLRERMLQFYNEKNRSFTHNTMCMNIMTMENLNRVTCIFYIEHAASWQDMGFRWSNRNAFIMHLKKTMEELEIDYYFPVQPVARLNDVPEEFSDFGTSKDHGSRNIRK
ncbi:hypothetical protein NQZ79_g7318 [Umbelopsis isabellina]|nr:hypothetical protein NQZ79_g7318 [Umbelopsis isabellina]